MKAIFKSKYKEKKKKVHSYIMITFLLILLFTFFWLYRFNKRIKNNLLEISKTEISRVVDKVITDKITHNILNENSLEDILVINKNDKGEILYIDFNLDKAYQVLDDVSNVLTSSIKSLENGEVSISYYDSDLSHTTNNITLNIPIGSTLSNSYFYNLGPKIPVQINFIGSVLTNLETKVTNYGLNNALVEVYVYIEFSNQILSSFEVEEMELKYNAVIASMMIEGEIPSMYNGVIESKTDTYSKSIE